MSLFQSLEARRLFAATLAVADDPTPVSVKLSKTGTLTVTGSSQKDKILISRDGKTGAVVVKVPSADSVTQGAYGVLKTGGYDSKLIKRIKVDGGGGGDVIEYQISEKFVPATLNGGKGDDRLTTNGRRTVLIGGSGKDTLTSRQGVYYTFSQSGTTYVGDSTLSPTFEFRGGQYNLTYPGTLAELRAPVYQRIRIVDGKATVVSTGDTIDWSSRAADIVTTNLISSEGGTFQIIGGGSPFSPATGLFASGNRLEGGDGDDTFVTFGTEDSIFGGNGNDKYEAPASGVDVYEDTALTPITPSKDLLTIRSRLFASDVEDITTKVDKTRGTVSVNAGTLADIA